MNEDEGKEGRGIAPLEQLLRELTAQEIAIETFVQENREAVRQGSETGRQTVAKTFEMMEKTFDLKEQIRAATSNSSSIEGIKDSQARATLRKLIEENSEKVREIDTVSDFEFYDKAMDFIWSLGGVAYIYQDYLTSAFLIAPTTLPKRIHTLIEEARICAVVNQANAAVVIGRMILEVAMNDIGERIGLFKQRKSLEDSYRHYPPAERADNLFGAKGTRREKFKELYDKGSSCVHSNDEAEQISPLPYLKEVIEFVENEYAIHHRRIKD